MFRKLQVHCRLHRCRCAAQPAAHEPVHLWSIRLGVSTFPQFTRVTTYPPRIREPSPRGAAKLASTVHLRLPFSQPNARISPRLAVFWPHTSAQRRRSPPNDDRHSGRSNWHTGRCRMLPQISTDQKVEQRPECPAGGAARSSWQPALASRVLATGASAHVAEESGGSARPAEVVTFAGEW